MNTNDLWKSRSHSLYNAIFELIEKSLALRTDDIIMRFDGGTWLVECETIGFTFGGRKYSTHVVFDIEAKLP